MTLEQRLLEVFHPDAPRSPSHATIGLELAGDGAALSAELTPGWRQSDGSVDPGLLLVIADTSLGVCTLGAMGEGQSNVTGSLRLDLVPGQKAAGSRAIGRGRLVSIVGGVAVVAGEVCDEEGTVLASATARCHVVARTVHELVDEPGTVPRGTSMADALPLDVVEVTPERTLARWDPSPRVANRNHAVHGGFVAAVLERAANLAVPRSRVIEHTTTYLRPVPIPSRGPLLLAAVVERAGRQTSLVTSRLRDGDGRLLALGSSTYLNDDGGTDG